MEIIKEGYDVWWTCKTAGEQSSRKDSQRIGRVEGEGGRVVGDRSSIERYCPKLKHCQFAPPPAF